MLSVYDARMAAIAASSGVDWLLVGDSVATVLLGYDSTRDIGMEEMLFHTKAVLRGAPKSCVIGDLPFVSCKRGAERALADARRFMKAGCRGVKLEWNKECLSQTRAIRRAGIPVMGHLGLTPQSVKKNEPFKVRAAQHEEALRLIERALALEKEGVCALVLECVPDIVAREVTRRLKIPVIGIGAGRYCDGQVLVMPDLTGAFDRFTPKFVKRYAHVADIERRAVKKYVDEVRSGRFPGRKNRYRMSPDESRPFQRALRERGVA